eukprot:1138698-Pelagomonas_calceolata.AAC.2
MAIYRRHLSGEGAGMQGLLGTQAEVCGSGDRRKCARCPGFGGPVSRAGGNKQRREHIFLQYTEGGARRLQRSPQNRLQAWNHDTQKLQVERN